MQIKEAAKACGVSVRTLQYYDKIGLLKPKEVTKAGYRIYGNEELERLQEVLFLRELDFTLGEIKELMQRPSYDRKAMLQKQRQLLIKKRKRLDGIIDLITDIVEGKETMSIQEFDNREMEQAKKQYEKEVRERWGATSAYEESRQKTGSYDKEKWNSLREEGDAIMDRFASCVGMPANSEKVQALVFEWKEYITRSYYHCTDEILKGLGIMYLEDERFLKNIDKHGEGTARLMSEAIACYVKSR